MSSIPTKQIDGDVAVGRNVSMGGTGTVRGSLTVGHNLTVEGWLEAKNIKGPNKGLFKTAVQLRESYPNPQDGWWALVTVEGSASSDHLGQLFVADGGTWVAQVDSDGNALLKGNPTIDSTEYLEAVEQMTSDLEAVKVDVTQNASDIKSLRSTQTTQGDSINSLSEKVTQAQSDITTGAAGLAALSTKVTQAQADIKSLADDKGRANGIAPLGEDGKISSEYMPENVDDVLEFSDMVSSVTVSVSVLAKKSTDEGCAVVYNTASNRFIIEYTTTADGEETKEYFNNWTDADVYGTTDTTGKKPYAGKIYIDVKNNKSYRWTGTDLVVLSSDLALGEEAANAFPGDRGKQAEAAIDTLEEKATGFEENITDLYTEATMRSVVNADKLLGLNQVDMTFSVVLDRLYNLTDAATRYIVPGVIVTFYSESGWQAKQWTNFGSKTYDDWKNEANWTDFGANGTSVGNTINVNVLCGDTEYTLSTAIQAVQKLEEDSGLSYFKTGIVLTFKTADFDNNGAPVWKAYQFTRAVIDIKPADEKPWVEFGGGGNTAVTTTDTPAVDSKEPFSAGGAYKKLPTTLVVDTETEGVVKMSMKNEAGDTVVDEVQFAVGTGSGSASGTIVSIQFEEAPFYALAGSEVILKASIRSITSVGSVEQDNAIAECVIKDRDTGQTLETYKLNQKSSASADTYDFSFDVSSYFVTATSKRLQLLVTDDAGNTGMRNINVSGVDVTVTSVQTLNYTATTVLTEGGKSKNIPMYMFANNASDKGIKAITEIQLNGEWQTLGTATVYDTYSKSISIDPQNCLGETLKHGAYALRIHGEDIASGVVGNYLYTSVMVINTDETSADYSKPIVVARWSDDSNGEKKLFEDITMDFACYKQGATSTTVKITCENTTSGVTDTLTEMEMYANKTYSLTKRIVEYNNGDDLVFDATCGTSSLSDKREVSVRGSLLDIEETSGALYKFDMEGRSNTDIDKTIKETATDDTVKEIVVTGANWSTNGFVADTFGTSNSGGRMSLRIAENVTAECTDQPFSGQSINQNGVALSLSFKVKNIADRNARIIKCTSDKLGFVLTGEKFIVTTAGDSDEALAAIATTAATSYLDDTVYRFDIVIEPESQSPYSGIQLCKVYQNGDMAACVPIDTTSGFPSFADTIHFDGTDADLYLYGITRWNTYYGFMQAFNNYIVNLTDTSAMLTEYEQNQVMKSVTAEGTTKMRPDMQSLLDRGVMVVVETRTANANIDGYESDAANFYPDYIEDMKDKDTKVLMDLYLYFPDRPWANCKVEAVPGTNQGTSTLAYPIKNKKFKFKKGKGITLLNTRDKISEMYAGDEAVLAKYDDALKLAKKKKIRIKEGSTPVNTITIKVDYSDSAGANNCALMELMNETQIKLGSNYMTPAQNFNTDTTEELHTSIDGITCALYRTDWEQGQKYGVDYATNPGNAYFHSKGNFNADKDNPHFFGFEDVKGYNDGCVNYGDFTEIVTPRGTAIDDYVTTVLSNTSTLTPGTLYMISEFCGPETRFIENDGTGSMQETTAVAEYEEIDKTGAEIAADSVDNYDWGTVYLSSDGKYYQYTGGKWVNTTGSMTYDSGTKQWKIVGRVLNPVECYEYRQYQEFCWQQGVNKVDDLLGADFVAASEAGTLTDADIPKWTTYYESRYPDDDDLNALYEKGKKVPYQLYRELAFCQQCNQNLTDNAEENGALNEDGTEKIFNGAGASTTIELDGTPDVPGTKENRLLKWQHEMHKYFSPYSTNCYIVASDYKATVDQRAKNMMIAVYKEADGNMRYYFNHWYDGDSVDEADNDCFLTIPWDMDGATSHKYQGWDGVMFQQTYALYEKGEGVYTGDKDTENKPVQLTLGETARAMRATKTDAGQEIFSPDGCYRYWMTNRILKWPKVVSSFDGERKYIETATASENRYPALHGLRLDSLPAFQRKRFAFRDGYYQTSGLYKHQCQARMVGVCTVTITAAQDGFFAIGKDNTSSHIESCYLKEGESYTFATINCADQGTLIYIFGSDKLGTLDLSGCTIKNNHNFSDCAMLKRLILGGTDYTLSASDEYLTVLSLDNNPFIEEIDVRNTALQSLNTTGCPRLKAVYADGSKLTTFTPAEASPLETLSLPGTLKTLLLKNLPKLRYPSGLSVEDMSSITSLVADGCPLIDGTELLDAVCAVATLKSVRVSGISTTKSPALLTKLNTDGTIGIDANGTVMDETGRCSGLTGRWILTELVEDSELAELNTYFPELEVINSQYSYVTFDDDVDDTQNITNPENGTTGEDYEATGHFKRIDELCHVYKCTYNTDDADNPYMECEQVSDSDYTTMADGTTLDPADKDGLGYDIMKRLIPYWYKGVNDYKNQKKHLFASSLESEPLSTATKCTRKKLSEILRQSLACVQSGNLSKGDAYTVETNSSHNCYEMDVEGMKQVRWPGVNSDKVGAVFVDEDDLVVGTFNMYVQDALFDFVSGDYVFCDVPSGAKKIVFSSPIGFDDLECIAVDSDALEAIEPDWVHTYDRLIGVYGMFIDKLRRPRSISGVQTTRGNGTHTTYRGWKYDATTGRVSNSTAPNADELNYTCKDFMNICELRGTGYQAIDYEMSKDVANLVMALVGDRDIQAQCGKGCASGYWTGSDNANTYGNVTRKGTSTGSLGNIIFGLQNFVACNYEWMDNVAVNVKTFISWKKNKCVDNNAEDPTDAKWHIYNPTTGEERVVQGLNASGKCIGRVKFGRHADVIASCFTDDSTLWNQNYSDGQWYNHSRGRVVGRAFNNASAGGGLVYASADHASSYSYTSYGSRLAFIGKIVIKK